MHKFLILSLLTVTLFACSNIKVEGVYHGEADVKKELIIQHNGHYMYKYFGDTIFSGEWEQRDDKLLFFNYDLSLTCEMMAHQNGKSIYILNNPGNGYLQFSPDVPDCNFVKE